MIGQTCRGIDEARSDVEAWARYIADQAERGDDVSPHALARYRDAKTDLRDMYATNAELAPGGEARVVFGGAS